MSVIQGSALMIETLAHSGTPENLSREPLEASDSLSLREAPVDDDEELRI